MGGLVSFFWRNQKALYICHEFNVFMGFSTFAAVFSYNLRLLALRHRPGVASLCALTMQHLQGQCYHSALSQEV